MSDGVENWGPPDMVVRSIEGSRWGELGKRMTPGERDAAVDALVKAITDRAGARLRELDAHPQSANERINLGGDRR